MAFLFLVPVVIEFRLEYMYMYIHDSGKMPRQYQKEGYSKNLPPFDEMNEGVCSCDISYNKK